MRNFFRRLFEKLFRKKQKEEGSFNRKSEMDSKEMEPVILETEEKETEVEVIEEITAEEAEKKKKEKKEKKKEKKKRRKFYIGREFSWLKFNERCLNEAANEKVPLAERLTFVSIFQSNLDEFFMVRVGSLLSQMVLDKKKKDSKSNMTAGEQLEKILSEVNELEQKKGRIYEQLMGELEPAGIRLINFNKLSQKEGTVLEKYFNKSILPYLSFSVIDQAQPMPFLNNKQLYILVALKQKTEGEKLGVVSWSNSVIKRLIEIPSRPGNFMLSEELILHFVQKFFKRYQVLEKTVIRVTRSGAIDTNEAYETEVDTRDAMAHLIKVRNSLNPVRVEITRELSKDVKKVLAKKLKISVDQIIKPETPLDMKFVFTIQDALRHKPELFYEKRSSRQTCQLSLKKPLIPQLEKKDVLLSYPFNDIRVFIKLLEEASTDDTVVGIKMTLYRVAEQSQIVEALIEAAEKGKRVDVLVELRARFDEENNIEVAKKLEKAGCHVIYGLNGLKVHSKLCQIVRMVDGEARYITQFGTGNYNEKTSKLYTDLSLITSNQEVSEEAAKVYEALQMNETVEETEHLLVAPHCMQSKLMALIDAEKEKALAGKPSYIGVKVNSLADKKLMDKLIDASKAGVKIDLVVRGICCLRPGVPGETDNIRVISIVGRFLEHSRIFRFGTPGNDQIFIASADFMTRNTIRRVEIGAPVYDEDLKKRIRHLFDTCVADDEKGKLMQPDGTYIDRDLEHEGGKVNSQEIFYKEAYDEETKN